MHNQIEGKIASNNKDTPNSKPKGKKRRDHLFCEPKKAWLNLRYTFPSINQAESCTVEITCFHYCLPTQPKEDSIININYSPISINNNNERSKWESYVTKKKNGNLAKGQRD
jgi:hypothetical protein